MDRKSLATQAAWLCVRGQAIGRALGQMTFAIDPNLTSDDVHKDGVQNVLASLLTCFTLLLALVVATLTMFDRTVVRDIAFHNRSLHALVQPCVEPTWHFELGRWWSFDSTRLYCVAGERAFIPRWIVDESQRFIAEGNDKKTELEFWLASSPIMKVLDRSDWAIEALFNSLLGLCLTLLCTTSTLYASRSSFRYWYRAHWIFFIIIIYLFIMAVIRLHFLISQALFTNFGVGGFIMMCNSSYAFQICITDLAIALGACLLLSNALAYFYPPAQRAGVTSAGESGAVDVENPLSVGTVNDK
jgi:hypothetical protein